MLAVHRQGEPMYAGSCSGVPPFPCLGLSIILITPRRGAGGLAEKVYAWEMQNEG